MRFKNLYFLFSLLPVGMFSQSFIGLNTDTNPANVVDSRTKIDINLIGLSTYASNDYTSVGFSDLLDGGDFDFDDDDNLEPSNDNNFISNIDVLGPSILFNINAKNSIALTTRARVFSNVNNIPGNTIELFDSNIDERTPIEVNNISLSATVHAWTEYGVTYGRVLMNNGKHFIKAGITAKYLNGYGYASAQTQDVSLDYDPVSISTIGVEGSLTSNGTGDYAFSRNLDLDQDNEIFEDDDDFDIESEATGLGFDLGVVYEYRKSDKNKDLKHKNKYFLKAGFSITDIGSLEYDDSRITRYDLNGVALSQSTLDNGSFEDIESRLNPAATNTSKKINLPAAMHLNLDWNAAKRLYVNLNTDLSLIGKDKEDANRIENTVTLTPRFETQFFSLYSPIGYRQFSNFNWGAGFRLGPIYAGSGSVISNLVSSKSKSIDVYAGLKIPIYYSKGRNKKIKDKDGDGIVDKEDKCPDVAGVASNNGCPAKKVEKEVVVEEVKEVIIVDTDGDSVADSVDKCPNEFGTVANNGCPVVVDTDGDKVPDIVDKCPKVFGVIDNGGCPEVKTLVADSEKAIEVEKTLESYAKVINFSSGKASFTSETYDALKAIQAILNEYPKAKFDINGYTDSVGSERSNQLLSEERAIAVKVYFIEKGITASRLNATGFGEANPIATNATPDGRRTNRRVEIKVAK